MKKITIFLIVIGILVIVFCAFNLTNFNNQEIIIHHFFNSADKLEYVDYNKNFTKSNWTNFLEHCEHVKEVNKLEYDIECFFANVTTIGMYQGIEFVEGFLEDATYSKSIFYNSKLESVYFGQASFVAYGSFSNKSECNRVTENNVSKYYCEKLELNQGVFKYLYKGENKRK